MRSRRLFLSWTAVVTVALFGICLVPAPCELLESGDKNYSIEIPYGWTKLPDDPAYAKLGIVVGAIREIETLKNGKPANGIGGQLHLAIQDMPEGKTLEDMAKDEEVRGFLMKRFGEKTSSWPEIEVANDSDPETNLPYIILKADGKAPNLKRKQSRVRAVMVLTTAKQKLFKLRVYGWHTEFDEEGLKGDLDVIETNFIILDPSDEPVEEPEGDRPPPTEEEEEEDLTGDSAEEKVYEDLKVGWRLKKPVGIKSHDWDKKAQPDAVAWFQDNTRYGSYQIILYVIPRARQRDGVAVPDMQLKSWGLDKWYMRFEKAHATGPIRTWKFPKRPKKFLLLPDEETEKEVFTEKSRPKDEKRIKKVDGSELIRKLRAAEKVKAGKLGKEKCIEAYRGVLGANRERTGREMVVRYLWGTPRLTCMLIVSFSREGYKKWSKDVQILLDSIEMTGRPSRR